MKKFSAQTGGRYVYVDDVLNLQELALAFGEIFDGCDNFVISGCEVNGTRINPGFVYINGEIRRFEGSTIASFPAYLSEVNRNENVAYTDDDGKVGRVIYGCQLLTTPSIEPDPVTGQVPEYLVVESTGIADTLRNAFFGKYALNVESDIMQTVDSEVDFIRQINTMDIVSGGAYKINRSGFKGSMSFDQNGTLIIKSVVDSEYSVALTREGELVFYSGSRMIAGLNADGRLMASEVRTTTATLGSVRISGSDIYNTSTQTNDGSLYLNVVGADGGTSYFRNTVIGDGKGGTLFSVVGGTRNITGYAQMTLASEQAGLTLQHTGLTAASEELIKKISWVDRTGALLGEIGYLDATGMDFTIHNAIGNVKVDNNLYVTGDLVVNGTNLRAYALTTAVTASLNLKANVSEVYSKTDADDKFVSFSGGLAELAIKKGGKQVVRQSIDAVAMDDVRQTCAVLTNYLQDVVTTGLNPSSSNYQEQLATRKRAICQNIGAAYAPDTHMTPYDTGWLPLPTGKNYDIDNLHVRQIGNIVYIQGRVRTCKNLTLCTLPNKITPPTYTVKWSVYHKGEWHCAIEANSRELKVVRYQGDGWKQNEDIAWSYMV